MSLLFSLTRRCINPSLSLDLVRQHSLASSRGLRCLSTANSGGNHTDQSKSPSAKGTFRPRKFRTKDTEEKVEVENAQESVNRRLLLDEIKADMEQFMQHELAKAQHQSKFNSYQQPVFATPKSYRPRADPRSVLSSLPSESAASTSPNPSSTSADTPPPSSPPPSSSSFNSSPVSFHMPQNPQGLDIAIIGAPNAGKSTLLNLLCGTVISAVSPKKNTTREAVTGVWTVGDSQICFYDTPGFIPSHATKQFSRLLSTTAWSVLPHCDLALLIVDGAKRMDDSMREAAQRLNQTMQQRRMEAAEQMKHQREGDEPVVIPSTILVLNKVDLVPEKLRVAELSLELNRLCFFDDTFMISAASKDGTDDLARYLLSRCSPRQWAFPANMQSDKSPQQRAEEVVRGAAFCRLNKELPYGLRIKTQKFEVDPRGVLVIDQELVCDQHSQIQLVIGKGGKAIKSIADNARAEMEAIFKRKVDLNLIVKAAH
eukprot:GILI01036425.1.p1 GENE.GILI01036425.1~~GILI01036425.1.p1  ORF type:complete len:485 (+),score=85.02 GILI01036425.1:76-1530(+)